MRASWFAGAARGGKMPDSAFRLTWRSAPSAAKLLAPEIIRNLGKAYRANCVDDRMDLRHQNIDLTQLGDNVLLLAALSRHSDPPSPYPTTYFKVDQFNGGISPRAEISSKSAGRAGRPRCNGPRLLRREQGLDPERDRVPCRE